VITGLSQGGFLSEHFDEKMIKTAVEPVPCFGVRQKYLVEVIEHIRKSDERRLFNRKEVDAYLKADAEARVRFSSLLRPGLCIAHALPSGVGGAPARRGSRRLALEAVEMVQQKTGGQAAL